MSVDLQMLMWTAVLCVLLAFPYTLGLIGGVGLGKAASYPQPGHDSLPDWVQRSKRCHMNLIENIAPFAILVLVAHVAGKANATTALGAQIFFYSRLAMVVGHTGGIPYLRTVAWAVSLAALVMILLQIL